MSPLPAFTRRTLQLVGAVALVDLVARAAYANSISSAAYLYPGILPLNPILGGLGTVLAAFIERPFLTRAGIDKHALRYALRANFLSFLASFPCLLIFLPALYFVFFAYLILAEALTLAVEGVYLRTVTQPAALRWRWFIAGNLLSALLLVAISVGTSILREAQWSLVEQTRPLQQPLYLVGGIIVVAALVGACWPIRRETPATADANAVVEAPSETSV